jgi:hypothetical protein
MNTKMFYLYIVLFCCAHVKHDGPRVTNYRCMILEAMCVHRVPHLEQVSQMNADCWL